MALKDRLNDALHSTGNARRQETLRAVLTTAGGDGDAEVRAAIAKIIAECEEKAAAYRLAGQTELAKAEHDEIEALRGFLRSAEVEPQPAPPSAKSTRPAAAKRPAQAKSLFSRTQKIIVGAVVITLAAVGGIYFFVFQGASDNTGPSQTGNASITLFADDRTLGNPRAPVTFLEYAAPTCPVCAHFALTAMPDIEKKYIATGKVFYIFRVFPLQAADGAVEGIARCLPKERYFPYITMMFRNQSQWDPDGYNIPDVSGAIIRLARLEGVTPEQANRCMTDRKTRAYINQVAQDGETRFNIWGTPTLVVDGQVVEARLGQSRKEAVTERIESSLSRK
ncbi:MAG: thioredoxin domain-containing protein [Alphaproteobacteria bacterium]|nr:thioredoxin domain-containing protein [Alphaproteobacteria bacterium]